MQNEYTTKDLKAIGFTTAILKLLHPWTTKTVSIVTLGNGYKARSATNVYSAYSIARDLTDATDGVNLFWAMVKKRNIQVPEKIRDALAKKAAFEEADTANRHHQ